MKRRGFHRSDADPTDVRVPDSSTRILGTQTPGAFKSLTLTRPKPTRIIRPKVG